MRWKPSKLPYDSDLETKKVLKKLTGAHRALAELKITAQTIPSQEILINTLTFQEAKDSSEVDNILTTNNDLYKGEVGLGQDVSLATKEVQNYIAAIKKGFSILKQNKTLTTKSILEIQEVLQSNKESTRQLPGTRLDSDQLGEVAFAPLQNAAEIEELMKNLEKFINDADFSDYDPLVKMAVIHFQFESIHPFYEGNGRVGRIINNLYLVLQELLELPILHLSRYIIQNKTTYYNLLQDIRDNNNWEDWLLFIIDAVEKTANQTTQMIHALTDEMNSMKNTLVSDYKFYSVDMLNHFFKQPYTRIDLLMKELGVSRVTASQYLNKLAYDGVLYKKKQGKNNYYINMKLMQRLIKGI